MRIIKKIKRRIGYEIKRTVRLLGYELFSKKKGYNYIPGIFGADTWRLMDIRESEPFGRLAEEVSREGRTLLGHDRLYTIYQAIENAVKNSAGKFCMAEVGVYRGGTSKFMTKAALFFSEDAEMYSIDTFEGHSAKDIAPIDSNTHSAGKFNHASHEDVKKYLSGLPITAIKGRIEDVSHTTADKKFNVVHIDTDLYGPTKYSLGFFGKRLATEGGGHYCR